MATSRACRLPLACERTLPYASLRRSGNGFLRRLRLQEEHHALNDNDARSDLHLSLGPALWHLTERERIVVTLRFYGNHSQSQIAERVGVSQMHVSRVLSGALAKLGKQLGPDAY